MLVRLVHIGGQLSLGTNRSWQSNSSHHWSRVPSPPTGDWEGELLVPTHLWVFDRVINVSSKEKQEHHLKAMGILQKKGGGED